MKEYRLKDICNKITDGSHNPAKGIENSEYLMLSSKNILNNKISFDNPRYLDRVDFEKEDRRTDVNKGDILLTIVGTVGRCAVFDLDEKVVFQRSVAVIKPKKELINSRFLMYKFISLEKFFENESRGVAQRGIYLKQLANIDIVIPSLDLQNKMVKVLDKAQELIDKRKEQIEALDELVKARFVEMFGDPVGNTMKWDKEKLINKCNIITGNTPSRKISEYYGDYIEWIKSDNITDNSMYLTKAKEYLSEVGENVGRIIEKDSILMTCIAGSIKCIGNVAIANRKVAFNQQINGIEPLENNVLFMFEQFKLSQKYIQSTINMSLKGILSKGQLSELEFIFPPLELQNQFANFVTQVDKLKSKMEISLKELEDNFNSLMQKAFKGELFN